MNCQQFREMIDSYISDELLVETNHDVQHHLATCLACNRKFSAHRKLRARLRSAVINSPEMRIDPDFSMKLRANLRETARGSKLRNAFRVDRRFLNIRMISVAAICLLLIAGVSAVWINYRKTPSNLASVVEDQPKESNNSNISSGNSIPSQSPIMQAVQVVWREIVDLAAGDHKNCALKFNLEERPISLEEAAHNYGEFNRDLDKAVIKPLEEIFPKNSAGEIKLLEAHSCVYKGRRFAHIVLRHSGDVISVLVTETNLSDKPDNEIINETNENLQVSGFRTQHYTVFVVSSLTVKENTVIAQTISKSVRQHIESSSSI